MEKAKLARILRKIPLFKKLSETEIDMILDMPKSYVSFHQGEIIMEEGERDDAFYILMHGKVSIWRNDEIIATVAPPNFLGEVGFIVGDPRVATVTAADDHVVAMKITSFHFNSLNSHIRECIKDKIIEGLVLRLNQTIDAARKGSTEPCASFDKVLDEKYARGETW